MKWGPKKECKRNGWKQIQHAWFGMSIYCTTCSEQEN
jgi:hypothetical protein